MDRPGTPLISKLIFAALLAICACLLILIAQNRARHASPEQTNQATAFDQTPYPEQWDAEPVRLKIPNAEPKPGTRPSLESRSATQLTASVQPEVTAPIASRQAPLPGAAVQGARPKTAPVAEVMVGGSVTARAGMPVRGHIFLSGQPPAETPIALDPTCGPLHEKPLTTRHYVISEHKLANVWVYIENVVGSFSTPTQEVVLDQVGCEYQPYVFGVMTGQAVRIRNSDPFLHNVNTVASIHSAHRFNIAQPMRNKEDIKRFEQPELPLKFMCNVHNWMFAYAGVFDHPFFAVTDANGRFEIPAGLPAGRYNLVASHLKAGKTVRELDIVDGPAAPWITIVFRLPGGS